MKVTVIMSVNNHQQELTVELLYYAKNNIDILSIKDINDHEVELSDEELALLHTRLLTIDL